MTIQDCINDLLMRGCDDWVDVAEITSVAKFTGHARSEEEIWDLSLTIIREVVQQGLMEIGDLPDQGGRLNLWPMTSEECLDRVQREWHALGRNPSLGEICWLQNTDKGNALGEELFRQRDAGR
jgi:hypothetical protein